MPNALSNLVRAIIPKKTEFELAHEVAQRNAALPISKGGLGLPADNTAMDRAKAMGFDTPVYHGTNADIHAFDPSLSGENVQYMKGIFTSDNPDISANYGDTIYPLLQNTGVTVRDKIIAKRAGLPVPNVDTIYNKNAGILVTENPSNIRSRFAAFDPAQRNSANILAGGALGAVGLGAMIAPNESQASEMPIEDRNALALAAQRNAEFSHPSLNTRPRNSLAKMAQDIENRKQIALAQAVATGRIPHDVAYGEQGLEAPTVAGLSIDPTDYIGPSGLKVLGGMAAKGLPVMAGMTATKGKDMARLIREAQMQIDAENAARNAVNFQPATNRTRNALIGIGAGGAGLAGGYYGTDYLTK